MQDIIIITKGGSSISAKLQRLRTPRAVLALVLEALSKGGRRSEIITAIQVLERHLGLELAGLEVKRGKR